MRGFFKRHLGLHLWMLGLGAVFLFYKWAISSAAAANAVTAVTQRIKDGYAALWYLVPFSVVEWFYVAFILGGILWVAVLAVKLARKREGRRTVAYRGLAGLVCLGLSIWGFYCLFWGVNYYADGFQEKSGIYAQPVTVEDLDRAATYFAQKLAETAPLVQRDEEGLYAEDEDRVFAASVRVYDNLSREFPFLQRQDRVPKKMFFSRLFSMMNFTGFYTPFTGESNLNVDVPACLTPANITHELAHQRGIASEQECNFLAIVAAVSSDDPAYQYSGYLMGYIHLGNALYRADREKWQAVYALLPQEVILDLRYHSAYWDQFEGLTADVSQKIYDSTLKTYGQSDGIKSYGTVVDLLVAYY